MFFRPKITTVFASRWKALGWSASVLMTAYCSIPPNEGEGADSVTVDPAMSEIAQMIGASTSQAGGHSSPWAIASPTPTPAK